MTTYDLYVTADCPQGVRCESCGTEHAEFGTLQPWAVRVTAGVLCLTLCPSCAERITRQNVTPPLAAATAERLVIQHCEHLRLNRHDMGLVLAETDRVAAAKEAAEYPASRNRLPVEP